MPDDDIDSPDYVPSSSALRIRNAIVLECSSDTGNRRQASGNVVSEPPEPRFPAAGTRKASLVRNQVDSWLQQMQGRGRNGDNDANYDSESSDPLFWPRTPHDEHHGVAGVYRHAGADGGLGEVNGGDVAGPEEAERLRQFRAERGQILAARGGRGIIRTAAADEDNA